MKRAVLVALIALALSACATPETRVRTALMDAGLSQPIAVEDFLKRTRSLQDPEILGVVSASGLICAIKA